MANVAAAPRTSLEEFFALSPVFKAVILALVSVPVVTKLSFSETAQYSAIYSGIFDLLAIFTGFISTFYIFIATKGNKFLQRISKTQTFSSMRGLLGVTICWSYILVIFSYVLMIWSPNKIEYFSLTQMTIFVWCINVFLICVNFHRCVSLFLMVVETADDDTAQK
ncbi:MAG: hypothetical protein AAF583_16350 [Pseudomonadota bacterium]